MENDIQKAFTAFFKPLLDRLGSYKVQTQLLDADRAQITIKATPAHTIVANFHAVRLSGSGDLEVGFGDVRPSKMFYGKERLSHSFTYPSYRTVPSPTPRDVAKLLRAAMLIAAGEHRYDAALRSRTRGPTLVNRFNIDCLVRLLARPLDLRRAEDDHTASALIEENALREALSQVPFDSIPRAFGPFGFRAMNIYGAINLRAMDTLHGTKLEDESHAAA